MKFSNRDLLLVKVIVVILVGGWDQAGKKFNGPLGGYEEFL